MAVIVKETFYRKTDHPLVLVVIHNRVQAALIGADFEGVIQTTNELLTGYGAPSF